MRLNNYLMENEKFSRKQKEELEDKIINLLYNPKLSKLMRTVKSTKSGNLIVDKKDLVDIFDILLRIREILIKLPVG